MATPDFILDLRRRIGHDPLWLSGVTAVVIRSASGPNGRDEVLLVRRIDTGDWTPVTGIIDPGEEPAVAAIREVAEEAAVSAEAVALAWVHTIPPTTYANGDRAQYLDLTFACRYLGGDPHPADGENTAAAFFPLAALPPMPGDMAARVGYARDSLAGDRPARFER